MAIRMETDRTGAFDAERNLLPNVEVLREYSGAEEGIHHGSCPHRGIRRNGADKDFTAECIRTRWYALPDDPATHGFCKGYVALCNSLTGEYILGDDGEPVKFTGDRECSKRPPLYMKTTHVGLVIDPSGEYNGRDDSDFYALVWDPERKQPEKYVYATTRGWTYANSAAFDATPEVLAAYRAWRDEEDRLHREHAAAAFEEEARRMMLTPKLNYPCRVVKGRKVKIGTEGICVRKALGDFGPRVGIKVGDGTTVWVAASNVERILAKPDDTTWAELRSAEERATPTQGVILRVVGGADAPMGTEGPCVWASESRVGVATSNRRKGRRYADVAFTDIQNVEVIRR